MIDVRARLGMLRRHLSDYTRKSLINLGAVAAVCLLLAGRDPVSWTIGAACGVATLVALIWQRRRELVRPAGDRLIGYYVSVRSLLFLAVAAGAAVRRPGDAGWAFTAAGVAIMVTLGEPMIKSILTSKLQHAVNLPGVPAAASPRVPPGVLAPAGLGVIMVGAVMALLALPGWIWLIIVVLVTVPLNAVVLLAAVRSRVASRRAVRDIPQALERLRPEFAVYYAASSGAGYQLGMWLPYLERIGRPFVVITREPATIAVIKELTTAPILVPLASDVSRSLDTMVVPTLRAAFYVQGSPANQTFQRFRKLTHVWLNHGDSDKPANFHPRHASYDLLFVAGQLGADRYAAHGIDVSEEKFVLVGRPQIEKIMVRDDLLPAGPRTVFYAPTWRGGRESTNYSSLPWGAGIVRALLQREATVIFRPHPVSYRDPGDAERIAELHRLLADDQRQSGREHRWGAAAERDFDVADCSNAADALITDVSSVGSDFLASGKPFAMVSTKVGAEEFRTEFKVAQAAYVIEPELAGLDAVLDQLLGPDELREQRLAFRRYSLGDRLGPEAAEPFLDRVKAILDR
ncbi:CDP-glycerol glycerophosphotransferase family protein [Microlunatus speluncae]|uniref:CDP-glycerol glycerophosphotransferase family protein n=1 Tax=Microlunatus speluncae TaxID=2594267 RepID=UPI0012665E2B|nr:CDP-glycerol glycerophosphotransferase family protein [Microlunatus speluncae]